MKKFLYYALVTCIAVATSVSCKKDVNDPEPTPGPEPEPVASYSITFTAVEGGSAAATVGENAATKIAPGEKVTIEATVEDGYEFTGWTVTSGGAILRSKIDIETSFVMPEADVEITPGFEAIKPTVYGLWGHIVGGTVEIRVDGEITDRALPGKTVSIKAILDQGVVFKYWTLREPTTLAVFSPESVSLSSREAAEATFIMPELGVDITAYTDIEQYTVSVTTDGHGTVAIGGKTVSSASFRPGNNVSIMAMPASGYQFKSWTDVVGVTLDNVTKNAQNFKMPVGNVSMKATFETEVTTPEDWVLIGGMKWAKRNVGEFGTFVATSDDRGMFYQFNRPKAWSSTGEVTGWDSTIPPHAEWAPENQPCPEGYRVPTRGEYLTLHDAVTYSKDGNRKGWLLVDKTTSATLFIPDGGRRYSMDGGLDLTGTGYYWTSTVEPSRPSSVDPGSTFYPDNAYYCRIDLGGMSAALEKRRMGYQVRCLLDE